MRNIHSRMTLRHINKPYFIVKDFDADITVEYAETYNIDTGRYEYFLPESRHSSQVPKDNFFFSASKPDNIIINGNSVHGYKQFFKNHGKAPV